MFFVFRQGSWLKFAAIIFVYCQAGHAQDVAKELDEPEVKAAVEEAAVLDICPDRTLLEVADIEVGECRSRVAKLAPVCWHLIDKLVSDYEIEKDEKKDEVAKDRFISIANVYASCIRGELLRQIVKSRRESHNP